MVEGVEARGGPPPLSPRTYPDPSHALLLTHISRQKKILGSCRTVFYGHHCTRVLKGNMGSFSDMNMSTYKSVSAIYAGAHYPRGNMVCHTFKYVYLAQESLRKINAWSEYVKLN